MEKACVWSTAQRRGDSFFSLPPFLLPYLGWGSLKQVCRLQSGEDRYKREYNRCLEIVNRGRRDEIKKARGIIYLTKELRNVFFWGRKRKQKGWLKICLEIQRMKAHSQGCYEEMLEAENSTYLFPSLPCSQDIGTCTGCCPSDTPLGTSLRPRPSPSPSLAPQSTHTLECPTQNFLSPLPLPATGQGWQCCSGTVSWAQTWTYIGSISVSFLWRYFLPSLSWLR